MRTLRHAVHLACCGAAVAARAASAAAQQGATFTYRVQSTAAARGAGQNGAPSPNMVTTVRMAGGNARVDFREGGMPMTRNGGYMLIRGADRQFVIVNPQERQAVVLTADGLGAGMGAITNNALVKMTMRDPRFAFEDLGPGERILGYPTRRVRVRQSSTTEVRVLGRTQRSTDTSTTEMWIAERPAGLDPAALQGWTRSFGGGLRRTNPELELQMTEYQRRFGDGLALRTVAVVQQSDGRGRATLDTVRTEVTELTRGRIDPSVFAVPAGYETVDAGQMMTAADSARRANGDTAAAAPGGVMKKAADEGVKGALGGLLRRRRP